MSMPATTDGRAARPRTARRRLRHARHLHEQRCGRLDSRLELGAAFCAGFLERLLETDDVAAGHEMVARSADHDAAHPAIVLDALQELLHRDQHAVIDGIARSRSIEGDTRHGAVDCGQQVLAHRRVSPCIHMYP
jgi:hypothetical protein